jgi:hypothetical protein
VPLLLVLLPPPVQITMTRSGRPVRKDMGYEWGIISVSRMAVCHPHPHVTLNLSRYEWEILSSFYLKDGSLLHSCPAHVTPNIITFTNRT